MKGDIVMKRKVFLCAVAGLMTFLVAWLPSVLKAGEDKDPVQDYVATLRAELSSGKVNIINQIMKLKASEAKAFWPIYYEYEQELFDWGDQRLILIEEFVTAQQGDALNDAQAKIIADKWFKLQSDRLELLKKYHEQITQELSNVRAAQFVQIEYRMNTMIDLMIASELPLIQ
jgi:hypothetical protein